jgi:hypothetical protein
MISLLLTIVLSQGAQAPNVELRAAMQLGAKSATVQRRLPLVNQVVLVPDEATYLDEIAKWSTENRWPVLFNQEPRASQFIRRFSPEQVWIRESVGGVGDVSEAMQQTVASAWGGEETISKALQNIHLPPLGVVITSPDDPARFGAVALAAGRGQLLLYMKNDWGALNKVMSESTTNSLILEIKKTLENTGLSFENIGDAIDAITVCMKLPARVNLAQARENPVAISDVIGRDNSGKRFAWTGWIFGNKVDTAYMAMCSLFLERDNYWFCNTYPNSGAWANYGNGNLPDILPKYDINSTVVDGSLSGLQEADKGGVDADVVYFTSKGNQDFLDMSDERTAPTWLPVLNSPSALYFLHSWSLKIPSNRNTVGGTWLARGVYAYIGSSHEPTLHAFMPPVEMLRRTMSLVPFLPAARWSAGGGMYSEPWRINTIGDPLMLCAQPEAVERIIKPATNEPRFQSLASIAQVNMKIASELKSDHLFAEAIRSVVLLGNDSMATTLWNVAMQEGVQGEECALAVLPALFREGVTSAFLSAFEHIGSPDSLQKDMLWQLASSYSSTPLYLLLKNIRGPYHADDIRVIADRVIATRGRAELLNLINECLSGARGQNKRNLERMRKKYDN